MSGELILLDFLDKFGEPQVHFFILEANYLNVRALGAYLEKILILRIVLSQMGHYIWNHCADNRGLTCDNGEITLWIICSVFQITD